MIKLSRPIHSRFPLAAGGLQDRGPTIPFFHPRVCVCVCPVGPGVPCLVAFLLPSFPFISFRLSGPRVRDLRSAIPVLTRGGLESRTTTTHSRVLQSVCVCVCFYRNTVSGPTATDRRHPKTPLRSAMFSISVRPESAAFLCGRKVCVSMSVCDAW